MNYLLNVFEILDFAVFIEQSGYRFYVEAMKKFPDKKTVELFQYLADEEFKHERYFANMKKELPQTVAAEDDEYESYMKDFCRSHSLANPEILEKKVRGVETFREVLDMALEFEKDSVIFFSELKTIIGPEKGHLVEKIIQEELKHIRRIMEYKNQLKG